MQLWSQRDQPNKESQHIYPKQWFYSHQARQAGSRWQPERRLTEFCIDPCKEEAARAVGCPPVSRLVAQLARDKDR